MTKRNALIWIGVLLFALSACRVAQAQDEDFGIEPRINVSAAGIISAPLNPSARFVNIGWGMTTGTGYNLSRSNALVGEFMWNKLYPTNGALAPIQSAFQKPQIVAYTNLFALTANYKYEPHGVLHNMYFIAGGGWYHRNAMVKDQVPISGVPCDPAWNWWGYGCTGGLVTTGLGSARYNSNTLGVNAGFGLTVPLYEAPYRFYIETRYHYAPSNVFNTQIVDISVGFRY